MILDICHQVLDLYSQKRPPSTAGNSLPSNNILLSGSIPQHISVSSVSCNSQSVMLPKTTIPTLNPGRY